MRRRTNGRSDWARGGLGVLCGLAVLVLLGMGGPVRAEGASKPLVHSLFMDHMVLQRGMEDPVWGWTTPGAKVTVRLADKTATATADANGRWMAKIGPLAAGGPYELTVEGPQKVTLTDVMVGDVWVSSGQSNMEFGLNGVTNGAEEIKDTKYPELRLFKVERLTWMTPRERCGGTWRVSSLDNARFFSAVSYLYGKALHKELKVPIGMIDASSGASIVEGWTSTEAFDALAEQNKGEKIFSLGQLKKSKDLTARVADIERETAEKYNAWWAQDAGMANGGAWTRPELDMSDWKTMVKPGFVPGFKGVAWFRKTVEVPAEWAGKDLVLRLGTIIVHDTTWVNGVKVGETQGDHTKRDYALSGADVKAGAMSIVVRVYSFGGQVGFWSGPEGLVLAEDKKKVVSLGGEWRYREGLDSAKNPCPPERYGMDQNLPGALFNGMIAPLVPFGIKGAIWYQGEFNAGAPGPYKTLLPAMIKDWRGRFGAGEFPFLIVQLPNNGKPQVSPDANLGWAPMREAQFEISRSVANSGIAVSVDTSKDGNLHPPEKQDIAKRLALVALAKVYGQKVEYAGPVFKEMKVEGGKVRISFEGEGGGLVAKDGKLEGFAIAGADKKYVWASAEIDGETVVVSAPEVEKPTAVRYAWGGNPKCSLYNKAGLPAVPFRTEK